MVGVLGIASDYFNLVSYTISDPISNLSISLLLILVVLLFLGENIFFSWFRVARWMIPIALLIVFSTPGVSHSWAIGGPTRETISLFTAGLFLVISLILIIKKSIQVRRQK